jgi:hypothetical protein
VAGGLTETLVLVKARHPVPYYEQLKKNLEKERPPEVAGGQEIALADATLGPRRGIGSNIQLVTPDTIVRDVSKLGSAPEGQAATSDDFIETCNFTLVGSLQAQ